MFQVYKLKPLLSRASKRKNGTFLFNNYYHHSNKMNKLKLINTRKISTTTTNTFSSLFNKSINLKFLIFGSAGAGTALYFSSSKINSYNNNIVYAAATLITPDEKTIVESDEEAKKDITKEGSTDRNEITKNDEEDSDTKKSPNKVIVKPDIWSWVLEAAIKDWIYYALAAGCSVGMAICMVLESRQFGEIYRIFAKGDDSILNEMTNLIYLFIAEFTFSTLGSSVLAIATSRLGKNLRAMYFQSVIKQDMEFFDKKRQGEILTHVSQDISSICTAVRQVFTSGLRSILTIVVGAGSMIMISPKLAGSVFLVLPTMAGAGHLLGMGLQSLAKASNRATGLATSVVGEAVTNIRTVKAFVSEDNEIEKFSRALEKAVNLKVKMGIAAGAFFGTLHLGINGMQLLLCFIGSQLISKNMIDAGSMVTATSQVMQLQRAFVSLSRTMTGLVRAMATCDGVYEVVLQDPMIEEKTEMVNMRTSEIINSNTENSDENGIVFSNVDFYYPTRPKHQILNSLNLKINQGHVVALVGSSGCGKSTVGNLLERFYDPINGTVSINGVDIKELSPNNLRKQIGLVDQQPKLFATSVIENIRYGRPDATDQEVIEASELANAHEFINGFPDGYETNLGEHGSQLSGGQRQRIAIARAILKDPSILILDEATSALDANSEGQVQEALSRVMKGRTVLVIAHRLSTIIDSDLICVMNRGKVVEKGNHQDLMRMNGAYAKLFRKQQEK